VTWRRLSKRTSARPSHFEQVSRDAGGRVDRVRSLCGSADCLSRYAGRLGMQKTLRTGAYERRTKAHETDDLDRLDRLHGLAKLRVASSNLVIRSRETPGERPFRGPLVASVVRPLYRFALPFRSTVSLYRFVTYALRRVLRMPWEERWGRPPAPTDYVFGQPLDPARPCGPDTVTDQWTRATGRLPSQPRECFLRPRRPRLGVVSNCQPFKFGRARPNEERTCDSL
jgi:hypothetical protein